MTTTEIDGRLETEAREEADRQAAIDQAMRGWTPAGDKLVLAITKLLERKVGSLVLAGQNSPLGDKVERRGRLARVVAAGPEATVAVNARVYCSSYAGAVIEVDGHSLLVLSESDVLLTESAE